MIDIRQSIQYANYLKRIGWKVERIAETNYFIKKFPIIGSVIKIQRPEELHNKSINQLANKYRTFQIIVEPKTELDAKYLTSLGYKLSKSPYLPSKTRQLDLTLPINRLISGMKKDTRRVIRNTQNEKHISYRISPISNIEEFRNAWKKAVGWKRYVPPLSHLVALKKSFKENCVFLSCFDESIHRSVINTGAIFLMADGIGYYWQAFTSEEGRKNLAQYKIVWEAILWAKKKGTKIFDFEGIYDARFPDNSWLGFTHFKKSFGGYEIEYPGCFFKWFILGK